MIFCEAYIYIYINVHTYIWSYVICISCYANVIIMSNSLDIRIVQTSAVNVCLNCLFVCAAGIKFVMDESTIWHVWLVFRKGSRLKATKRKEFRWSRVKKTSENPNIYRMLWYKQKQASKFNPFPERCPPSTRGKVAWKMAEEKIVGSLKRKDSMVNSHGSMVSFKRPSWAS